MANLQCEPTPHFMPLWLLDTLGRTLQNADLRRELVRLFREGYKFNHNMYVFLSFHKRGKMKDI